MCAATYEFFAAYIRLVGTHADYDDIDAATERITCKRRCRAECMC
jgi:hypothetical protein